MLIADNIRPGGKWDPKNLGLAVKECANMKKAEEILKSLGQARMDDKHKTSPNDDTEKGIVDEYSKKLAQNNVIPDMSNLATKTKCTPKCIADNVAKISLSGAEPATENDEPKTFKDFYHRADLPPNATARKHLLEMGVAYNETCLIDEKNIKINYDLSTRQLIKKAAVVVCQDRDDKDSEPEESAIHAILVRNIALFDS